MAFTCLYTLSSNVQQKKKKDRTENQVFHYFVGQILWNTDFLTLFYVPKILSEQISSLLFFITPVLYTLRWCKNIRQGYLQIIHFEQKVHSLCCMFHAISSWKVRPTYRLNSDHVSVSNFNHLPKLNKTTNIYFLDHDISKVHFPIWKVYGEDWDGPTV